MFFCSWKAHPQALAIDALTIPWNRMLPYALSPIYLILIVLEHMKKAQCKLILIAPQWPRRHWYTTLPQMCIAQQILYHPNLGVFNQNVWLLSTNSLDQKGLSKKVRELLSASWRKEHKKIIHTNSNSSVVGVVQGNLNGSILNFFKSRCRILADLFKKVLKTELLQNIGQCCHLFSHQCKIFIGGNTYILLDY